jgi:hypothetical protein
LSGDTRANSTMCQRKPPANSDSSKKAGLQVPPARAIWPLSGRVQSVARPIGTGRAAPYYRFHRRTRSHLRKRRVVLPLTPSWRPVRQSRPCFAGSRRWRAGSAAWCEALLHKINASAHTDSIQPIVRHQIRGRGAALYAKR